MLPSPLEVIRIPVRALPTAVVTNAGKPLKKLKTVVLLAVSASIPLRPLPDMMFPGVRCRQTACHRTGLRSGLRPMIVAAAVVVGHAEIIRLDYVGVVDAQPVAR